MTVDFDVLPRLLQELCEGVCGQYCVEVFKHTLPNGGCLWECRSCYVESLVTARMGHAAKWITP